LDISGFPSRGSENAKVIVVEFSDFECPFCERFAQTVFPELREKFVSAGRIQYMFANNPLPMHTNARMLASAAICAESGGHYWEMHDALFEKKPRTRDSLLLLAEEIGLNPIEFSKCFARDGVLWDRIDSDVKRSIALGLRGTPSFVVGRRTNDGGVLIKKIIRGAQSFETFTKVIEDVANGS
jgi:protein-disulfide isomerase